MLTRSAAKKLKAATEAGNTSTSDYDQRASQQFATAPLRRANMNQANAEALNNTPLASFSSLSSLSTLTDTEAASQASFADERFVTPAPSQNPHYPESVLHAPKKAPKPLGPSGPRFGGKGIYDDSWVVDVIAPPEYFLEGGRPLLAEGGMDLVREQLAIRFERVTERIDGQREEHRTTPGPRGNLHANDGFNHLRSPFQSPRRDFQNLHGLQRTDTFIVGSGGVEPLPEQKYPQVRQVGPTGTILLGPDGKELWVDAQYANSRRPVGPHGTELVMP